MLDKDLTTVTKHLHDMVDSEFIPLRSFIDLLLQDQDEDRQTIADVLDAVYWQSMSRLEREFKQIEEKTGTIEATYTTAYHPDKGAGLLLDARFIPPGKADHPTATAKKNSQCTPDKLPDVIQPESAAKSVTGGKLHPEDLIDAITLGYSAVRDALGKIETEPDPDTASTLAGAALVLYKNASDRTHQIVSELEKKIGNVQILMDIDKGFGGYDSPIMGIVIRQKEVSNEE